jgi:hypothetical protein
MVSFSPDLTMVSATWSTRSLLNINMAEKKRGEPFSRPCGADWQQ